MVTLSKPISSGQAQAYHKEEFANAKENYYTEGKRVRGEWQGQQRDREDQAHMMKLHRKRSRAARIASRTRIGAVPP